MQQHQRNANHTTIMPILIAKRKVITYNSNNADNTNRKDNYEIITIILTTVITTVKATLMMLP